MRTLQEVTPGIWNTFIFYKKKFDYTSSLELKFINDILIINN